MKRNPKVYNQIGHVRFPIYHEDYHDLAYLRLEDAGILTVRLLVEDTTIEGLHKVSGGPAPTRDDFLVGCDRFATAKEAHEYFGGDRKIVENFLLGVIDWAGVKRVPDTTNVVEFFKAGFEHLDQVAQSVYRRLEAADYPGCQLWLVTSLNRDVKTVDLLMQEVTRLGLGNEQLPRAKPVQIICKDCEAADVIKVKPNISARRLGWRKIGRGHWVCPDHNKDAVKQ